MLLSKYKIFFFISLLIIIFIAGCEKDEAVEENPYDSIVYDNDSTTDPNVDPYSITGLHKNILSLKCAVPGCHDGTFEPDYRTVQSAYSTLVYHPVNRFTVNGTDSFTFRVIPFDTLNSFLHERITTPTTEYMPSNGTRLSQAEIQQINTWIMNGAKDENGNIPTAPNSLPVVQGYVAFDSVFNRLDTIRYQNISYNPFVVPQGLTVYLYFLVVDDSTLTEDLINNKVKFSLNEFDFTNAVEVNASFINLFGFKLWTVAVNSSQWNIGNTVYFRYYCSDGDHPTDTEFPRDESYFYYRSIYAMKIQ